MYMLLLVILLIVCLYATAGAVPPASVVDCYTPVKGGWRIRISSDKNAVRLPAGSQIGVNDPKAPVAPNPRDQMRALFPPADRTMILTPEQIKKTERYAFRPLIMAFNAPRFMLDCYSAGGAMGHLLIGTAMPDGRSKWFSDFGELDITYTDGRMDYRITDPDFPGLKVSMSAAALAKSAGMIVKVQVSGAPVGASLVWMYGGASTFFTNKDVSCPEFRFAPNQCTGNVFDCKDGRFTLTQGFPKPGADKGIDSSLQSGVIEQIFALAKYLPDWKAVVRGGDSWNGRIGLGDPDAVLKGPAELVKSTQWDASGEKGRVVVGEVTLTSKPLEGFIAAGMGGDIDSVLADAPAAWKVALTRNEEIAGRVTVKTPDPYLNSAMPMIAFATEGIWGDTSILHGGWSWRYAYLGWRGWYGPDCYGWTDRIRKSIVSHTTLSLVRSGDDQGGLGSLLEYNPGVYYNMDEVFLDQTRQYFDYTNDFELMREIFPVLQGIVEWENRRLRPASDYLYESSLNTWISDQHWYIRGQCTQASAYMLRANEFLANLAERLGKDPAPYRKAAEAIRSAMQRKLWMPRAGVFAEYIDTLGNRMLHPEPELPTIYHSSEFGAADTPQVYQMLHWADTHLRTETTPNGGKLVWSSNWFPNMGRSYTHSTYEMACAEELNYALTNYLAGRADVGYDLIRGIECNIYSGYSPGGVSCHAYVDGRQRANIEFADGISMWGRAVCEGMFGIMPHRPDGYVELSPQFPSDWPSASIDTRHFSYEWRMTGESQRIEWKSPVKTSVHLRLPLRAASITQVSVDGKPAEFEIESGVGLVWLTLRTPSAKSGSIEVDYKPGASDIPREITLKQGETLRVRVPEAVGWLDPQGLLNDARIEGSTLTGTLNTSPGPGLLFVSARTTACKMWVPVRLNVIPREPVAPRVWSAPKVPAKDLSYWQTVDLSSVYNAPVPEVVERVLRSVQNPPPPASTVNTGYYRNHLDAKYWLAPGLSDAFWRSKVGEDSIAWTADGIPFRTSKTGDNIAVATLAGVFPESVEFPVDASGKTLYLMISGLTFAMQSHVTNVRAILNYADGSVLVKDMVNPFDIGDCWGQYHYHDTAANGFENIGGRSGPAGSIEVEDLTKPVRVDNEAHLVAIELKQGLELKSVRFEAVANDAIFGVMGATILK